jgi:hypothetical protein
MGWVAGAALIGYAAYAFAHHQGALSAARPRPVGTYLFVRGFIRR